MHRLKFVQTSRTAVKLLNQSAIFQQQQWQYLPSSICSKHTPRLPFVVQCNHYAKAGSSGFFAKITKSIGFFSKSVNKTYGFKVYETLSRKVNINDIYLGLSLPDTFHSWFVIMELHTWMLMTRLMAEGDDGRAIRNAVVEALWQDVEFKSKKLELAAGTRRKQIAHLEEEFRAFLFSFDEAVLSPDHVLAGAIWRHIYAQEDFDPRHMDLLVQYVRRTVAALDNASLDDLLEQKFQWLELKLT